MRLTLSLVALLLLPWNGPAAGAAAPMDVFGTYHALVIGINDYQHLPKLKTAVVDAEEVARVLEHRYDYRIHKLINPTRYDLVRMLNKLRQELGPTDNLLVYYAGHGILDRETDRGFWLPVDAEPDNEANWVSNETVTSNLGAMLAKHVLVVSDSCYSGTLTRSVDAGLRTGQDRTEWLRRMAERRARTALVSGGLEPVTDGGGRGHSVFARAFIDSLKAIDRPLDTQTLFDGIKRQVVENADQTPEYSTIRKAGHEGGDFVFVPVGVHAAAPAEAPAEGSAAEGDALAVELAFWDAIKGSESAADYRAYLDTYPQGRFAALAEARLAHHDATPRGDSGSGLASAAVQAAAPLPDSTPPAAPAAESPGLAVAALAPLQGRWRGAGMPESERRGCGLARLEVTVEGRRLSGRMQVGQRTLAVEGGVDREGRLIDAVAVGEDGRRLALAGSLQDGRWEHPDCRGRFKLSKADAF